MVEPKSDATIGCNNDLMSRLSSFLPQIRAANIDLVNTRNPSILQIDQNILIDENGDGQADEGVTEDNDDDDDEKDDCLIDENTDVVHISVPKNKRRKYEASTEPTTVVMEIHLNQDVNDPLFQALIEKSSDAEDDDDIDINDTNKHENNDDTDNNQLPNLVLPNYVQNPNTISKGGCKLIEEVNDR
jgi:hypothetical protein